MRGARRPASAATRADTGRYAACRVTVGRRLSATSASESPGATPRVLARVADDEQRAAAGDRGGRAGQVEALRLGHQDDVDRGVRRQDRRRSAAGSTPSTGAIAATRSRQRESSRAIGSATRGRAMQRASVLSRADAGPGPQLGDLLGMSGGRRPGPARSGRPAAAPPGLRAPRCRPGRTAGPRRAGPRRRARRSAGPAPRSGRGPRSTRPGRARCRPGRAATVRVARSSTSGAQPGLLQGVHQADDLGPDGQRLPALGQPGQPLLQGVRAVRRSGRRHPASSPAEARASPAARSAGRTAAPPRRTPRAPPAAPRRR